MTVTTSQPLYIVFEGRLEPYCAERVMSDMTWDGTVEDIANVQFENLNRVIEVGTGRDVTDRMIREACDLRATRGDDNSHKFGILVELFLGTRAARPFLRAA